MKWCRARFDTKPDDLSVHRRYLVTVRVWSDRPGETEEDLEAAARVVSTAAGRALRKHEASRHRLEMDAWESMYGADGTE